MDCGFKSIKPKESVATSMYLIVSESMKLEMLLIECYDYVDARNNIVLTTLTNCVKINMKNFNRYSEIYDAFYLTKNYSGEFDYLVSSFLRTTGGGFEFEKALEIGCGTGKFSRLLSKHVKHLTATDINSLMINKAKQGEVPLNLIFEAKGIAEIVKEGSKFNLIILLFHVFSYFNPKEIEQFQKLIDSQLLPGGYLIFDFWDIEGVKSNPPEKTIRIVEIGDEKIIRKAISKINHIKQIVEIEFEFTIDSEQRIKPVSFSELHTMHFYKKEKLLTSFGKLDLIESLDLVANEKYTGLHYGNTLVFRKN